MLYKWEPVSKGYAMNDWLVFNANFSNISAISWRASVM